MTQARVLVFTGNGKGKTTAALGMVLRNIGHGRKVAVCQFIKHNPRIGEFMALGKHPQVRWLQSGKGFLPQEHSVTMEHHRRMALRGWRWCRVAIRSPHYTMILLDEICNALHKGLLPLNEVLQEIRKAPSGKIIVCTGRNAPTELIQIADTVTEMVAIKHAFLQGTPSQMGVEK